MTEKEVFMDIRHTWLFTRPIAHRGLHNDKIPENSIGAFENAIANDFPIELDVRLIDDGTVVVFHDDKLARMTNNDGYICNLKKEDLTTITLGKTEEHIPTFEEVLRVINGRVPLLIELKNEGKIGELEGKTLELLRNYEGEYAVQSFNPYSIEYFKNKAPEITRGILSCFFENASLSRLKKFALKRMLLNKMAKPDFVSYRHDNLPNKYVTKTKLPTLAWTINNNADMEKVIPHCDNIIFEGFIPKIEK